MTPSEQEALSRKYILAPFCIYPHEDGSYTVFNGHGQRPFFEVCKSNEELGTLVRESFSRLNTEREVNEARREVIQSSSGNLLDELGI